MDELLSDVALSNLYLKGVMGKHTDSQKIPPPYTIPKDAKTRLLLSKLVLEEALETVEALGFEVYQNQGEFIFSPTEKELDIYKIIDGACDTIYVAVGVMMGLGVPDLPHLEEVCKANDAKFPSGKAILNEWGKGQKPPGWRPPNHEGVAEKYGTKLDLAKIAEKLVQEKTNEGSKC